MRIKERLADGGRCRRQCFPNPSLTLPKPTQPGADRNAYSPQRRRGAELSAEKQKRGKERDSRVRRAARGASRERGGRMSEQRSDGQADPEGTPACPTYVLKGWSISTW